MSLSPCDHEGQMYLIALFYRLAQFVRIGAFKVEIYLYHLLEAPLVVKKGLFKPWIKADKILEALADSASFRIYILFPIRMLPVCLVDMDLDTHLKFLLPSCSK